MTERMRPVMLMLIATHSVIARPEEQIPPRIWKYSRQPHAAVRHLITPPPFIIQQPLPVIQPQSCSLSY